MKIKPAKKFTSRALLAGALLVACGCRPAAERLSAEAASEIESGHFRIAIDLLQRSAAAEKKPKQKFKYLLEAARLARFEIQDYERAIRIYREIILSSGDEGQRINAQEAITEIELENLQNYSLALKELQILEPLLKDGEKKEKTQLRISQAFYLTGSYQQALEQITISLPGVKTERPNFLKLKAQTLAAMKKYKDAVEVYEAIRVEDPAYFESENLFMATSVVYEEGEDYAAALSYLEKFEKHIKDKSYLELRTKRLKGRLVNKPLFKGERK